MVQKLTFELNPKLSNKFLKICALKNISPDHTIQRLMREWIDQNNKKNYSRKRAVS